MSQEIEPKIKKLVTLLNKIPYLEISASCQGHFTGLIELEKDKDLKKDEYAHVIFELPKEKEKEFEKLAYLILSNTSPHFSEFLIDLNKRYYSPPESGRLYHNWKIEIIPFKSANYSLEKRESTDQAISLLEEILTNYLQK